MRGRETVPGNLIFRERTAGESPYENIGEGVLEQRREQSSVRRRILPLKGM